MQRGSYNVLKKLKLIHNKDKKERQERKTKRVTRNVVNVIFFLW
jgi:hypothetical protein